jgi:hypothetical protein
MAPADVRVPIAQCRQAEASICLRIFTAFR